MSRDFWCNSLRQRRLSASVASTRVLASPPESTLVVETCWRQRDTVPARVSPCADRAGAGYDDAGIQDIMTPKNVAIEDRDLLQRHEAIARAEGKTVDELTTEAVKRDVARRWFEKNKREAAIRRGNMTDEEVNDIVEAGIQESRAEQAFHGFEKQLSLLASGRVCATPFVTHRSACTYW